MPKTKKSELNEITREQSANEQSAESQPTRTSTRRTVETTDEKTPSTSFYGVDYNELDKDLSPEHQTEWTNIYASFRSNSPLTGIVIGVDVLKDNSKNGAGAGVLCLVIINFRVKVLIPLTEIWFDANEKRPDYVIRGMVGAKVDYVITKVDRVSEWALASRRVALEARRGRFFSDRRGYSIGETVKCNVVTVGPNILTAECNGFDLTLGHQDLSYTAREDLRKVYKVGQELNAKLTAYGHNPVVNPVTGYDLVVPEDTSDFNELHEKDLKTLEIVEKKISQGGRVLIYTSWVRIDTQSKLFKLLTERGYRVNILTTSVAPNKREEWVEKQVANGVQVLITNPSLVETGLELNDLQHLFTTTSLTSCSRCGRRHVALGVSTSVHRVLRFTSCTIGIYLGHRAFLA